MIVYLRDAIKGAIFLAPLPERKKIHKGLLLNPLLTGEENILVKNAKGENTFFIETVLDEREKGNQNLSAII